MGIAPSAGASKLVAAFICGVGITLVLGLAAGVDYSPPESETTRDQLIAASYLACARAYDFDPGDAQVVTDSTGEVLAMRTGTEVPASVHGPCFAAFTDSHSVVDTSSWGNK